MAETDTELSADWAQQSEDARLLARLQQGSETSFAEFHDRFAPGLHRFAAARFPGDAPTAEDIVVQTLARAIWNLHRFDPRRSCLAAWLYGIARGQIRTEVRLRQRSKSIPVGAVRPLESLSETPDVHDLAADVALRLDAQQQVRLLAGALTELEMEVLVLRCADELSAKEIGQIVGKSERAVHSLLHRAKQKARERLVQHDYRRT
ncbi:MAG: RNA polymerase sigma factor [Armatimonadota bacterium]|jgi:RNA polymerase sigma-70 factor (ECF subfamily)